MTPLKQHTFQTAALRKISSIFILLVTTSWFGSVSAHEREILVVYSFASTDPEFIHNLRFFVREAVQLDTRSEYFIIVQESTEINVGS